MTSPDPLSDFRKAVGQFAEGLREGLIKLAAEQGARQAEAAANREAQPKPSPRVVDHEIENAVLRRRIQLLLSEKDRLVADTLDLRGRYRALVDSKIPLRCVMCYAEKGESVPAVYVTCGHSVCANHVDEVAEGGA